MCCSNEEMAELIERIKELKLYGCDYMCRMGFHIVHREYNGIGPEKFKTELRAKITKFLHIFAPAAVIHDLRNFQSNAQRAEFNYANWEFWANCMKCADATYPWWHWKRYRAYAVAKILYDFVSGDPGWDAWMACWEKKNNKE